MPAQWSADQFPPHPEAQAPVYAQNPNYTAPQQGGFDPGFGQMQPGQGYSRQPGPQPQAPQPPSAERGSRDIEAIHRRLDGITATIERLREPPMQAAPQGVGGAMNDALLRLDQRLLRMSGRAPAPQSLQYPAQPYPNQNYQSDQYLAGQASPGHRPAAPAPAQPPMPQPPASQPYAPVYHHSPPTSPNYAPSPAPAPLDLAIAEITARQNQLTAQAPKPSQSGSSPQFSADGAFHQPFDIRAAVHTQYPPAPTVDLSGLERQLEALTAKIETMRRPDVIEQTIATFRGELADIRRMLTEALPREAIHSLENEIRALAQRIDRSRETGSDDTALAGIERALNDIYGTVRTLTPAEQLTGFDESIRSLGGKIDLIVRASQSADAPGIMNGVEQLQSAITALRDIVSHVASNDAVERLAGEVRTLSQRVDRIVQGDSQNGLLQALEQRISLLTETLESRERPSAANDDSHLEAAIAALSDRIAAMQPARDNSAMLALIEQRISMLFERINTTPSANSERLERSLSEIHAQLEQQRVNFAALADAQARFSGNSVETERLMAAMQPAGDGGVLAHIEQRISSLLERMDTAPPSDNSDRLERSLSEIRAQLDQQRMNFAALSEAQTKTPDNDAETERLRRELNDIREGQTQTHLRVQDSLEVLHNTLGHVVDRLASIETDLKDSRVAPSRLPQSPQFASPVAAPVAPPLAPAAPMMQRAPELPNPVLAQDALREVQRATERAMQQAARPPATALRLDQIAIPTEAVPPAAGAALGDIALADPQAPRAPIDASLPPDHPLEPGMRPQAGQAASDRIAASEAATGRVATAPAATTTKSDFIAAARRAAAAATPAAGRGGRVTKQSDAARTAAETAKSSQPAQATTRIRSLLVGASVVVIVLGTLKMAMNLFEGTDAPPAGIEKSSALAPASVPSRSLESVTETARIQPQAPAMAAAPPAIAPTPPAPTDAATNSPATADVTGSVSAPNAADQATPPADTAVTGKLPDTIGGPQLRTAALKGDPTAAYEIGVRFAEGKGVPANYEEAATWYEQAAGKGVLMAAFRLGTLHEKGLGTKKDLDAARRYYKIAAEGGNAKAMHNLAVLDADGGGKGADYKSASDWFRKAASRGVADSQYNLGILFARGIGVEQNLAESYKWFSLAAAQGDADAGRKRDDVAKRLDPQSQAAATLAIQTFMAEPQPAEATTVATPPGGWDRGSAPASVKQKGAAAKGAPSKSAPSKTASVSRASK